MLGLPDNSSFYSTDPGVVFAVFAVSPQLKSITTTWTIEGNYLVWKNAAFLNGEATICKSGKELNIYFTEAPPTGCTITRLSLIPGMSSIIEDVNQLTEWCSPCMSS